MEAFQVHILAADHTFYEGPCESLVVPTVDGEAGILAHHCNIIAAVVPGELRCRTPEGEEYRAAVSEGLVKVEGGDVLVLVDSAERPEEIDANRARRAADRAREEMIQKRSIQEYRMAQANLARALNRLRVKGGQEHARGQALLHEKTLAPLRAGCFLRRTRRHKKRIELYSRRCGGANSVRLSEAAYGYAIRCFCFCGRGLTSSG